MKNIIAIQKRNKSITVYVAANWLFAIFLALVANTGNAVDISHSQLIRNNTLENVQMMKQYMPNNKPDKYKMTQNNALNRSEITKKAKELEGVFLSVMLDPMFPEGNKSDLFGGGNSQGIYRAFMLQEYGKAFADSGGVGLAKGIEKQLSSN